MLSTTTIERPSGCFFKGSRFVKELTAKDFDEVKTCNLKKKDCCIVLFYVPWCPYCESIKDTWSDLGEKAIFYNVKAVNCEKELSLRNKINEDMPNLIKHYPTMIIYKNGEPIEQVGETESTRDLIHLISACTRVCSNKSKN